MSDGGQHFCGIAGRFDLAEYLRDGPVSTVMNVVRSTPMYLRPYMDFSFHTPYASQIL